MEFCDCSERELPRTRALTWEDHPDCGWPAKPGSDDAHGQVVHEACGRVVEVVFCTCRKVGSGFVYNEERGWWVHATCGWPTELWFRAGGPRAPEPSRGVKPRTWTVHKKRGDRELKRKPLTNAQRELDIEYDGRSVNS